jgi:hypothetical protein
MTWISASAYMGPPPQRSLWRCPQCGWVEHTGIRRQPPRCYGSGTDPHPVTRAVYLDKSDSQPPSAGPRRFS